MDERENFPNMVRAVRFVNMSELGTKHERVNKPQKRQVKPKPLERRRPKDSTRPVEKRRRREAK